MKTPREWLNGLLEKKELANDGSEQLAREWLDLLDTQEDLTALFLNKAWQTVMTNLERDFKKRMAELVETDAELKSIKKMFIRTIGLQGAEARIEKQMVEYLHEDGSEQEES